MSLCVSLCLSLSLSLSLSVCLSTSAASAFTFDSLCLCLYDSEMRKHLNWEELALRRQRHLRLLFSWKPKKMAKIGLVAISTKRQSFKISKKTSHMQNEILKQKNLTGSGLEMTPKLLKAFFSRLFYGGPQVQYKNLNIPVQKNKYQHKNIYFSTKIFISVPIYMYFNPKIFISVRKKVFQKV